MCNCKKTKQVETQVITGTPEPVQVPKPISVEEIIEVKEEIYARSNGETE
jgi:hypothetical protein